MSKCTHENHNHDHDHQHNHKLYLYLYIFGLVIYLISFLIKDTSTVTHYLKLSIYYITLITSGFHVIFDGLVETFKETIKHKKPRPNVHILMALAAIGAIIIGYYREAVLLILIFAGAHYLEDYAHSKSTKEIENLLNLTPAIARLINPDGTITLVSAKTLKVGDKVKILNGDEIPSDGIIIAGSSEINEASITGESVPKFKTVGDLVFGSTINGNEVITIEVNRNSDETIVAKIIKMVSETKKDISKTAKIIKKIEPIYVTSVIIFAPIFYILGRYLFNWDNAFYRTMVLLIGTSPCALAVTDIPATLSAISNLAKNKILFKGGSHLENLASFDAVFFDKTGTLTKGVPEVSDVYFIKENSHYKNIIFSMENKSNHPIAVAIMNYYNDAKDLNLSVENIIGIGLKTDYNNNTYKLVKPSVNITIESSIKEKINKWENEGKTVILFLENSDLIALFAFIDDIKTTSYEAINYLNQNNIETIMITGDNTNTANTIAKKLNLKKVYSNILPHEKANIIKEYTKSNKTTVMIGDGINDAPALAEATIGIAMGDGTDIAIDVADGVLMQNDLSKFIYTIEIAKKLKKIVIQNIIFAMTIVLFLVIMNFLNLMEMPLAVIFHEGSTLLVILNGLRMLRKI